MQFSSALLFFLPLFVAAQGSTLNLDARGVAVDVDSKVATPVIDARADAVELADRAVSTKCAAVMRRSLAVRDLESGLVSRANCDPVMGTITNPDVIFMHVSVEEQRCANSCICRHSNCMSFSWVENLPRKPSGPRGHCRLYGKTLAEMGFTENTNGNSKQYFQQRTCYHKAKPSATTGLQTLAARATPPPSRRDNLENHIVMAMAGL